jgi:DNA-binding transcriptional regulator/RsmH inhibitor MraZ
MDLAGIDREVVLVGVDKKIELWDKANTRFQGCRAMNWHRWPRNY